MRETDATDWRSHVVPPIELPDEEYAEALTLTIIQAHDRELLRTGGFAMSRANDGGRVESLVFGTFLPVFGSRPQDRYADIFEQVSHFAYHLAKNHPFSDGNKRTAVLISLSLLRIRNIDVDIDDSPIPERNLLYQWITALVTGELSEQLLAERLRRRARLLSAEK